MTIRLTFVALVLCLVAAPASAQVCQWCELGGKDLKTVKILWYKVGEKPEKGLPPVVDLDSASMYKAYKGKDDEKTHAIDSQKLQDWLPELYTGTADKGKPDGYYFLCYRHFDPEKLGGESISVDQGRESEKGKKCTWEHEGKPCERMGYKAVPRVYNGETTDVWYCPVHIDAYNRQESSMPLMVFAGLAAVIGVGIVLGFIGIKIGDKERAVEEPAGGGGRKRR